MSTLIVGCGYLGRRVARRLIERGERVVGTTRSATRAEELSALGIEPIVVDLLRPDSLTALPAAERALICVGFDRAAGVPMRAVYVEGLRGFLERCGGRIGRLVYAGSTGVYSREDGGWVDEEAPTGPRHESGRIVREAEELLLAAADSGGPPVILLRFAGLYGPGRIPRRAALLKAEPIVGDPDKALNLVHIDDAAAATVAALERGQAGRVYNIVDDRPVPRRVYYTLAAELLGAPAPRFEPPAPGSPGAFRDESHKRVANRRMREELGVASSYPDITSGLPAALAASGESTRPGP